MVPNNVNQTEFKNQNMNFQNYAPNSQSPSPVLVPQPRMQSKNKVLVKQNSVQSGFPPETGSYVNQGYNNQDPRSRMHLMSTFSEEDSQTDDFAYNKQMNGHVRNTNINQY